MLHMCNICGLLLPSSTFVILPTTLSCPHHLCPSRYVHCRAGHVYVSRVVLCLSAVCDVWTDVGEHVCVGVGLASDEAHRILQTKSLHLVQQATNYVFNWRFFLCSCARRDGMHLPSAVCAGYSLDAFCASSVPFCSFRHRDSNPGRSGESRVSWPARL